MPGGNRVLPKNMLPISTRDIIGITDGSEASIDRLGYYTQVLTSAPRGFTTTTQYRDFDTVGGGGAITVGPGDWQWGMTITSSLSGATMSNWTFGIGTATGNSAAGLTFNDGTLFSGPVPTASYDVTGALLVRKLLTASTTFYGKVSATFTAGLPTYSGIMWARRMR